MILKYEQEVKESVRMIKKSSTRELTFLTSAQAARYLNMSVSTLKKFIYQGKIKTIKTPGGHYRILKSDLLDALYGKK